MYPFIITRGLNLISLPGRSKFFPSRVGPILEVPGKQTGSYKSCFPL